MDDLSGYEPPDDPGWRVTVGAQLLLAFARETYFPFLVANARALDGPKGAPGTRLADLPRSTVRVSILGRVHEQPAFKYQKRCLEELRRGYAALSLAERGVVEEHVAYPSLWHPTANL